MDDSDGGIRLIRPAEVEGLLDVPRVCDALDAALARSSVEDLPGCRIPLDLADGAFHLVSGVVRTGGGLRFVVKANRWGPAGMQGLVLLCDADTGRGLALMDSAAVTRYRTAALAGVATKHLARRGAHRLGLLGAGRQARLQAPAVRWAIGIDEVKVWDRNLEASRRLVALLREDGFTAEVAPSAESCVETSDVVVSAVPSRAAIVDADHVPAGALIIALGADAPGKREHESRLLLRSKVVTDVTDSCAMYGELQHVIREGLMRADDVYAELAEIVADRAPGRTDQDEIVLVDSTGSAIQDAVAATIVLERAAMQDAGEVVCMEA